MVCICTVTVELPIKGHFGDSINNSADFVLCREAVLFMMFKMCMNCILWTCYFWTECPDGLLSRGLLYSVLIRESPLSVVPL